MNIALAKPDFSILIDYKQDTEYPARVFKSLSEILDTIQYMDNSLLGLIEPGFESALFLQNVQAGSPLKVDLRHVIRSILEGAIQRFDDAEAKSYLNEANIKTISYTSDKNTITNIDEVKPLQQQLVYPKLAAVQPTAQDLLKYIQRLSDSTSYLSEEDEVEYIPADSPDKPIRFNKSFRLPQEQVELINLGSIDDSEIEMVLMVKKPDLLGKSKWDFRLDEKTIISCQISDDAFIERLQQEHSIALRSGDSLHVRVKTTIKKDKSNQLIGLPEYEITKVLKVIPLQTNQKTFGGL